MPAAAMMGQAAGTAVVQAVNDNESACELDSTKLISTLRANSAILPE